jgi:uncharacterized cofD-like protein
MRHGACRAVAVGGGTGLPKVLRCLLDMGLETSAVVTMADDGGSSGLLRRELGMLPPGDARNCLVAMAAHPDSPLARIFNYRFPHGEGLAGHALGNLVIAALSDIERSFPEALAIAGDLLEARGRVLPSTVDDVVLAAEDVTGVRVVGQAKVAASSAPVMTVHFDGDAPVRAYGPAVDAIVEADLVVVGPGSLFTSVLPNLLVGGITDALRETTGRVVYVCNVVNQRGETTGMDAAEHVDALLRHGLDGVFDTVVVHDSVRYPVSGDVEPVDAGEDAVARIREHGVDVIVADVADPDDPRHHGAEKLSRVLAEAASR